MPKYRVEIEIEDADDIQHLSAHLEDMSALLQEGNELYEDSSWKYKIYADGVLLTGGSENS